MLLECWWDGRQLRGWKWWHIRFKLSIKREQVAAAYARHYGTNTERSPPFKQDCWNWKGSLFRLQQQRSTEEMQVYGWGSAPTPYDAYAVSDEYAQHRRGPKLIGWRGKKGIGEDKSAVKQERAYESSPSPTAQHSSKKWCACLIDWSRENSCSDSIKDAAETHLINNFWWR